ncbi:MAG: hypothetical protein NC930_04715 [Candidatus Omnitrophica bacterium]|nr:hypothetical protein [Candidatus Omnitrophota bacterium]
MSILLVVSVTGCATLFGWSIHAPGILSEKFYQEVQPIPQRIALYVNRDLLNYESKDRGGKTADPQTYFIGEAFGPMLVEAFQRGFEEFIFLEAEPTSEILQQSGIPYLAVVQIKNFSNHVTWKGQTLQLVTQTVVLDSHLSEVDQFESTGISDARKVFAKKGGPEVNLNAALENNARAVVQYVQDSILTGKWKGGAAT